MIVTCTTTHCDQMITTLAKVRSKNENASPIKKRVCKSSADI